MIKVMVVEDESSVRKGIKVLLEEIIQGYKVCWEAENGQRAIDILKIDLPELIITDIRMPKMSGISFIKLVKDNYHDIPIIVVSGHDDFIYVRDSLRYGVQDYLLKPIDRKEFSKVLNNIFEKSDDTSYDEPYFISQIKKKIEENMDRDLTLSYFSDIMNLHPNYISNLFRKHTGMKLSKYILESRLTRAKELLIQSRLKVYDIAFLTGFSNAKYFSSVFKKHTGYTPHQYRTNR